MPRARVLIADDHPFVVEALTELLADEVDIVGAVGNGEALVETALRLEPDVILTDLSMPGLDGTKAVARLKAGGCQSKIIVITMYTDPHIADEAIRAGASGFVLKQTAGEELITAINDVMKGRTYISPAAGSHRPSR